MRIPFNVALAILLTFIFLKETGAAARVKTVKAEAA